MGSGLDEEIYLTLTLQSYNYLSYNLTPHKLKTLFSLSCVLAPGFLLVIFSFVVVCPQYLSVCLPQSFLALWSISTGSC
jgi:hypothetical protein